MKINSIRKCGLTIKMYMMPWKDAHAAIIMTEWDIYKKLDWEKCLPKTKQPFWIFDTRLVLDPKKIGDLGINLWQLGYGKNH